MPSPAPTIALDIMDEERVARGAANLREQPDGGATRLSTLQPGERVTVTGKVRNSDWLQVRSRAGRQGYVLGSLLAVPEAPKPAETAAAQTPTAPTTAPVAAVAAEPLRGNFDFGRYHALIIGNQGYRHIRRLATPEADVRALAALLKDEYGFQDVRLVTDATRAEMLRALDNSVRQLGERDNLLIYYAGHGYLDRNSDRGYWLPVDAESDSRVNWLSNADITDTLKASRAKHVMVVADSCYSGSLVRALDIVPTSDADLRRLARAKARTVMTSGGLEPVTDTGGGRHSVFAKAFFDGLRANDGVIDGAKLFAGLRRKVLLNADQTPQYADIRFAGHDGGDFLFVRKKP